VNLAEYLNGFMQFDSFFMGEPAGEFEKGSAAYIESLHQAGLK
jgi:hypothetical protein